MVTVSLRLDDEFKSELDEMCAEMGMNITTFFMLYAKKALRERKIPFEIAAPKDMFYTESNIKRIQKSIEQVNNGKVVTKTINELEVIADEQPDLL